MSDPLADLLGHVAQGPPQTVYLLAGDLVLVEPAARKLAEALAEEAGCEVKSHRRPASLSPLLADLRTLSLFSSGKVLLVLDSAALADRQAAANLVDEAADVLPLASAAELASRERQAASRLLQALHLFDLDTDNGDPESLLGGLPDWAFQGGAGYRKVRGGRGRSKKAAQELRAGLSILLEAARLSGLRGRGEGEVAELSDVIRGGLPTGHALVLGESAVAADHPVVGLLRERRAFLELGRVEEQRGGGFAGLDLLARELESQTGAAIERTALAELARRTLRQSRSRDRSAAGIDGDSTARFAGEYRKLANLTAGRAIDLALVRDTVVDRGEEDVWQILDAVGEGRAQEALSRVQRLLGAAEDPIAARLSFFALFAGFCRQLTAVRGMMRLAGVPGGERSYPRFKSRHAGALQGDVRGAKNPLAGLHPFRLHRAYLTASRLPEGEVANLPGWVLETEHRLKGESGDPDTALADLVTRIATLAQARR
jgi:DNA polymerase III delta subunit